MEDEKLIINIAIPKDVLIGFTTKQIEQYIQEAVSNSVRKAIQESENRLAEQIVHGETDKIPVGICPRSNKNAF